MTTARNRSTDWKQRYADLLEQQEKQQARYKRKQELLIDAVVNLTQFGRDLDPDADEKLLAMRGMVRQKSLPNVDLANVVEALEQQLESSLKSRKQQQAEVSGELGKLVKRVRSLSRQKALQTELDKLQKAIETRPWQLATLATHLGNFNQLYAQVLKETKSGHSLLHRWFGAAETGEVLNPPVPPVPVDTISLHLSRLLEEIEPVEDMRGTFEVATDLLANGLTVDQVDLAVQSVTEIVLAAISQDRAEMTGYLSQMNERLEQATTGLAASQAILKEEISVSQEFGEAVQSSVGNMRREMDGSQDLTSLKSCINNNLDQMMLAVEEHRSRGDSIQTQLSDQLEFLVERARKLEAQGIEAEQRVIEQRRRALTDSLTGLPNREAYEETAAREVQRWQRYDRPLCLAVCDIDLFKTINDSYGHAAGDEALKHVAQQIQNRLRGSDFVARFGGEEFVVLLPETDREAAMKVMESVRQGIEASRVRWEKTQLTLTISIGIADFKGKDILQSAFTRADRALYQAKMNGRNRTELALD